jgi:hypothetical protein
MLHQLNPLKRPDGPEYSRGFSLAEMAIAGTVGFLAVSIGLMLYRAQSKMHLRQTDVNEAQLTVDYVANAMRTLVVSAGGGLPQMVNGLRPAAGGKGLVAYVNPLNLVATVPDGAYADSTAADDGIVPVTDVTPILNTSTVLLTFNENFALAGVQSIDTVAKIIVLKNVAAESSLGGVQFVYPVDYCSLYVDSARNLKKTFIGKSSTFQNIPLAQGIDSISVTYDLSSDGNGTFTNAVADSNKVSRVKLYLRVKGLHSPLAGSTFRKYETIIGVRRGRLYNKAV